jgi:hypothetical protein
MRKNPLWLEEVFKEMALRQSWSDDIGKVSNIFFRGQTLQNYMRPVTTHNAQLMFCNNCCFTRLISHT